MFVFFFTIELLFMFKMEEINEKNIHQNALKLAEEILHMPMYKPFFSKIQELVASSNVTKTEFKETLQLAMKEKGLETELRNTVFQWMSSKQKPEKGERFSYLKKANMQWEKRIHKSLNSMCLDLGIPLGKLRTSADREEIAEKWNELSTYDLDLSKYRPVYASKDFLEVLLSLSGPSYERLEGEPKWEFCHIPLKVKTLDELRVQYPELSRGEPMLGVNPYIASTMNGFPSLEAEHMALGIRVVALQYAPVSKEYLKKGCPKCLRAQIWAQVLGTNITQQHIDYYGVLKNAVIQNDLMIDKLIFKDVQLTASNDDQYFVFEDLLYQVMLCFSRDSEVQSILKSVLGAPMSTTIKGKQSGIDSIINFPPSGVIPFHGFTMYATPFCYLYDDPVKLYFTFRAFYTRYWHRLHTISTHPQGIVSLCLLYERLLQAYEPDLWSHFRNLNVEPIRIVLKWLVRAFSGHLPPEQLLLLWDLVLARDSLEPLPLLAVAIISFRRENICQVRTAQNIEAILADLSTISVMTLLQLSLMKE